MHVSGVPRGAVDRANWGRRRFECLVCDPSYSLQLLGAIASAHSNPSEGICTRRTRLTQHRVAHAQREPTNRRVRVDTSAILSAPVSLTPSALAQREALVFRLVR